jgi:chromatin remodeling complex protein RSC6
MAAKKKAAAKKAAPKKAAPKKAAQKKAAAKKAPAKKAAPKKAAKRKPNAAFMAPYSISSELAAVIGPKPRPRTQVTSDLWAYIKKHNLQDAKNRRMINADDALKKVFGGKSQVTMFDMNKHVNKHLKK